MNPKSFQVNQKTHKLKILLNLKLPMTKSIFQDNNQSSLLRLLMDMDFTHCKILEDMQDIKLSSQVSTTISVDLKNNGSQEFNTDLIVMFIISKFRFNSFHFCVMLILRLITMEVVKKQRFYKLMRKLSTQKITETMLIHGMKLKNLTLIKPLKEQMNLFCLNLLI